MTAPAPTLARANVIEVPGKSGPVDIEQLFNAKQSAMQAVLPKYMSADRLVKVALLAMTRTTKLRQCSAGSLVAALVRSAEIGLEPDGIEGALVPYYNKGKYEAQFQPMYQGLIRLALQHPKVLAVSAETVCEGDEFDYDLGSKPFIHHKFGRKRGEALYAWAVGHLRGGAFEPKVLTREMVDATMRRSPSMRGDKPSGPWVTDFEAMARKTAVKRLSPYLPKTTRMKEAVKHDDIVEGDFVERVEADVLEQVTSGTAGVKARLASGPRPSVVDVKSGETEEAAAKRAQEELLAAADASEPEPGGAG